VEVSGRGGRQRRRVVDRSSPEERKKASLFNDRGRTEGTQFCTGEKNTSAEKPCTTNRKYQQHNGMKDRRVWDRDSDGGEVSRSQTGVPRRSRSQKETKGKGEDPRSKKEDEKENRTRKKPSDMSRWRRS